MSLFYLFAHEWNDLIDQESKSFDQISIRKYWKLISHIGSDADNNQEKWIRILYFCNAQKESDNKSARKLAQQWSEIVNIMSKKDDNKVQMIEDIIRLELSQKITVLVFSNNSAIFTRKIAGNAVTTTVRIPDIYNEQESTRLLYLASETGAFDVLKKIRKLVEQKRFMGIEFDEALEDL